MKFFVLFIFCFAANAETKYIHKNTSKFLAALNTVEASGKSGNIIGDNGKALGPYQIHRSYYEDAKKASGKALNKDYSFVSDKEFATEVVLWYFYRYEKEALENGDWRILARLHNGGPNWRQKENNKYWLKIKKILDK